MSYEILPVLNDLIPDEPVITKPDYVVPVIAVAVVAAVAIRFFFSKKKKK